MTSLCPTLRALLKLGFEPRSPKFGAPTVGYKFDCLDLTASDCINRHFQRTIMLSGVLSTRSTIAVIESEMPHDLELPQDAAAWLSHALRSYQQKLSPLPEWMIEGEKNWDVIPFIWEARASEERIRAYDKRTRCNLDRDCARMLRAKLQAELPKHPIDISVLIGNGDMHAKNWSLIYRVSRAARLSPAYDFLSTLSYIEGDGLGLKLGRVRRFSDVTWEEFDYLAAKAGLPLKLVQSTGRETVEKFRASWSAEAKNLPLPVAIRSNIDANLARVPIAKPK